METKHLSYFKVENFKRFDSLEVNDIGQFNLIVGDNNVGKTTLLEALLFDDENYNQCLRNFRISLDNARHFYIDRNSKENYFSFFAKSQNEGLEFSYKYSSNEKESSLLLKYKLKNDLTKEEIENLPPYHFINHNELALIEFSNVNSKSYVFINDVGDDKTTDYIALICFNQSYGEDLIDFFSKMSLSNVKFDEIKSNLRYFIPSLTSIEINNAIIKDNPLLVIRESDKDNVQPLTQYGDGFIKVFRCLLEIEMCENKRLMIDEIDTGVHYSRTKDFFKNVIQSAKNKNVQIFATTHSKECLGYFTEALAELKMEDEGRIIRLANTKSGIKTYTMRYEEFDNALAGENEIR